jgi:cytochrome c oxidase assembly factor CtaG
MDELLTAWDFEPTVIAGCAALFAGYLLCHPGRGWRLGAFLAADLMLLLALISPLDVLADNYLFSAHMVQHLILLLGVPPLLLLGLSENFARSVVNVPLLGKVERYLNNPILASPRALRRHTCERRNSHLRASHFLGYGDGFLVANRLAA